jgi:FixJ family two-component response regulator
MDSAGLDAEVFASAEDCLASPSLARTTCVILDMRMPGMTGLELHRRLKTSHPYVPVIFISGHADDQLRARALAAGAADFFEKPFSNDALLKAVESARATRGPP